MLLSNWTDHCSHWAGIWRLWVEARHSSYYLLTKAADTAVCDRYDQTQIVKKIHQYCASKVSIESEAPVLALLLYVPAVQHC